ncbi:MAG: hypothetical protein AAF228_05965 [Pseudomonadota bacterium]
MTIKPEIFKAALALSELGFNEFCETAKVDKSRVSLWQNRKEMNGRPINLSAKTFQKIEEVFSNRGITLSEDGVSYIKGLRILNGRDGFRQMYEDLYKTAKNEGGEIRVYNGVSKLVIDGLGASYVDMHKKRMFAIRDKINSRTFVERGDNVFFGNQYSHYRWFPPEHFNRRAIFLYGEKVAFVDFGEEIQTQLHNDKDLAETIRFLLDLAWEHIAEEIPKS